MTDTDVRELVFERAETPRADHHDAYFDDAVVAVRNNRSEMLSRLFAEVIPVISLVSSRGQEAKHFDRGVSIGHDRNTSIEVSVLFSDGRLCNSGI